MQTSGLLLHDWPSIKKWVTIPLNLKVESENLTAAYEKLNVESENLNVA